MQFVQMNVSCAIPECPNFNIIVEASMKLDEHGCVPWLVCGVCQSAIIENPHPPADPETP